MKNEKLKLEELKVQSFTTSLTDDERGYIRGADGQVIAITPIKIPIGPDTGTRSCFHECQSDEYITCVRDCVYPEPVDGAVYQG